MAVDYDLTVRLKSLVTITDNVAYWYAKAKGEPPTFVNILKDWIIDARDKAVYRVEILDRLESALDALVPGDNDKYIAFFSALRDIEQITIMQWAGFDLVTGLRSRDLLEKDYGAELNRLSRNGDSFVVTLMRLDYFDTIEEEMGDKFMRQCVSYTADCIQKVMREFDDGYYLGRGEFFIILRQTDMAGSLAAQGRVKEVFDSTAITMKKGERDEAPLTFSSTLIEPMPGDAVKDLIVKMREYLQNLSEETNVSLQYREMSPAERYAKAGED